MSFYSVFRYGVLQNSDASDKILLFIRNFFYLYKIPNYNLLNKFILRNKKKYLDTCYSPSISFIKIGLIKK